MPDDRLFHPRLRMSVKVSALNHLEFRVWVDYVLVADNFGVLPYAAVMMRAGNPALAAHPEQEIEVALDNIVSVGLLVPFYHQAQRYLCDPLWQDFQKIRYPKATYYPAPSLPEVFGKLSDATQHLFRNFHVAFQQNREELTGASHRLEANGKRLVVPEGESEGEGFSEFYELYPRHVAKPAAERAWRQATQKAASTDILDGLRRQLPDLKSREQKFVPHPATWLNQGRWTDEAPRRATNTLRPANEAVVRQILERRTPR